MRDCHYILNMSFILPLWLTRLAGLSCLFLNVLLYMQNDEEMEGVYTESQLDEMHAMTEEDDDDDVIQLDGELFLIKLCYQGGNMSRMILWSLFYHLLKPRTEWQICTLQTVLSVLQMTFCFAFLLHIHGDFNSLFCQNCR